MFFTPTLEGFVDLFTVQTHQSHDFIAKLPPPQTWYEKIARDRDMVIAGPSRVVERFLNSLIIGFGSTILATFLGTLAAYGFSRFRVPLGRRPAFLHPVDAHDAADRGRGANLHDVSLAWPLRHAELA